MRILIDLQGAQSESRSRGIGRYSLALAKAVVCNRDNHEIFILLSNLFPETIDEIKKSFSGSIPAHHFIVFSAPAPVNEIVLENSWRVRSAELVREKIINDIGPDILLISSLFEGGSDNSITSIGKLHSSKMKTAVILYDLIPLISPAEFHEWEPIKNWYSKKIVSLKRADLLLSISNSARQEAIEHLMIDPQRIVNISTAANSEFNKNTTNSNEFSEVLNRHKINRKFLMHSSAYDERKNFVGLIKAFAVVPKNIRKHFQLVLVCGIDHAQRKILNDIASSAGLESDQLILTGYVLDNDLIALYSECYLFVFPSFHEGFGLPALEAMSCGAAVIGSNTSSIPEVIGRHDALFDPNSTKDMAQLIEHVLSDKDFYKSLKEHAKLHAKKFSWDDVAKKTIAALENLHAEENIKTIESNKTNENISDFNENIVDIDSDVPFSEQDLIDVAVAVDRNDRLACRVKAFSDSGERLKWRIEGPFDSTYSLALLNRETAKSIEEFGHLLILHSPDYTANQDYLDLHPGFAAMNQRCSEYSPTSVDVLSRNNYPPIVEDMTGQLNLLHHYAWEETGYPQKWTDNFNDHLDGITCLSNHVEKILIDNGVSVPLITSGCGVDHWEKIKPDENYKISAKKFRFLHVSSCFPRKGVDLLLDAYGQSFTSFDDVTLVIKTFENIHNDIHHWLADRRAKNSSFPDVLLIFGDKSEAELKALYALCHVLVAPSCAEGFGLPMAEAMLTGLPVITTAWGGQLDFCSRNNSWLVDYKFAKSKSHFNLFSSAWAEVDISALSNALTEAFRSSLAHLKEKALAGRNFLLENFKWEDTAIRAIGASATWSEKNKFSNKPKVGWLSTWNTKCGIATYSEHLLASFPSGDVTVFSPAASGLIQADSDNCVRYSPNRGILGLDSTIVLKNLNTIVIQFNYGLYNFEDLIEFINRRVDSGLVVILFMHATGEYEANLKLLPALMKCDRILVHSINDLNHLKAFGLIDNVALFPHGVLDYPLQDTASAGGNTTLIASYGFCLPHKGLIELVEAIAILKKRGENIKLRMVNAEYPAPVSTQLVEELKLLVRSLGIDDCVEMITDFLSDDKSLSMLSEASLIIFPYQQTGESASGAVRYGLATKRPIAVTPLSIFDDIGDSAFRFSGTGSNDIANGIVDFLHELSVNSEQAKYVKGVAENWREQHAYSAVSKRLFNINCALLRRHSSRVYRYHGSSPLLKTGVGRVQGGNLVTKGEAGIFIHGPYLSLAAGDYKVTVRGAFGKEIYNSVLVDIAMDKGARILGGSALCLPDENGLLASVVISINESCSDLEVRIWVDADTDLQISMIEIIPWDIEPMNESNFKPSLNLVQEVI
jgi:O-antigen biosynthesis alpha-1,2-mannosyltransferase